MLCFELGRSFLSFGEMGFGSWVWRIAGPMGRNAKVLVHVEAMWRQVRTNLDPCWTNFDLKGSFEIGWLGKCRTYGLYQEAARDRNNAPSALHRGPLPTQ